MRAAKRPGQLRCCNRSRWTSSYLLWADGRARVPGCSRCRKAIASMIKQKNGKWACIVGWRTQASRSTRVG
jgi:hypothetical protein